MRIDIYIYRWHDPDLVMLHEAGYSLSKLTAEAVSAYAHGKNIKIDVSGIQEHVSSLSNAKKYRYAAIFDDSDTVTISLIKQILPRFKSAFCKTVLRNSLSALMTGGFFRDASVMPRADGSTQVISVNDFRKGIRKAKSSATENIKQTDPVKSPYIKKKDGQPDSGYALHKPARTTTESRKEPVSAYTAANTVNVNEDLGNMAGDIRIPHGQDDIHTEPQQRSIPSPAKPSPQPSRISTEPVVRSEPEPDTAVYTEVADINAGIPPVTPQPAQRYQPDEADDEGIVYVDDDGDSDNMSEAELLDAFDKL